MKIFSILFFVCLLLAFLGFWFWRTHDLKNFVESKVKQIEENQGEDYTFKHGGIETHGFPLSSEVSIKYPSFVFKDEDNPHEVFLDGDLIIGSGIGGTKMWIKSNGDLHVLDNSDVKNRKTTDHWVVSGDQRLVFSPHDLGVFNPIPESFRTEDLVAILKDIANKGEYSGTDVRVRNVLHNETVSMADAVDVTEGMQLMDIKNLNANWANESKDKDLNQFVFSLQGNYENALLNQLKGEDKDLPDLGLLHADLAGSITYDKNLDFDNPEQLLESIQTKPFSFEITRLNSANNFDSSNTTLALRSTPHDNRKLDVHFDVKNDATYSKEGYEVLVYELKKAFENMQENVPEETQKVYAKLPALVEDIIPRYYELGSAKTDVDFDLDLGGGFIPFMLNHLDLKHLDWTSPLYGVRVNGSFRGPMEGFLGSADISIDNYRHLVESLASYYNTVLKSLSKAFGESEVNKRARQISPELVEKIVLFLKRISNDPSKDSQNIVITVEHSSNGVKVGTLPAEEVVKEGNDLLKQIESTVKPETPIEQPAGAAAAG